MKFRITQGQADAMGHITSLNGMYSFETAKIGRNTFATLSKDDSARLIQMTTLDPWMTNMIKAEMVLVA